MSSPSSMTFGRNHRAIPRGALWFGSFAAFILGALRRLDRWQLERRDEPRSAEEVLAWASRIERTDPGFAADLRAAVARSQINDE